MKNGTANTTSGPGDSTTHNHVGPDVIIVSRRASTWAMMNRTLEAFAFDLESLRRRSDPEESTNRRNFSIASKFIDGVKSDDLRTMLATYYTLSNDSAPTPEEMRQKSREYMLMKPKKYSYSDSRNMQGGNQPQRSSWYKPRDDMDKRRSCANCGQLIITWQIAQHTSRA